MRLVLFILLATPSVAAADCIYTGAKRSYLECIYAEAVAATAQATATAADVLGLDARLGAAESSISFLDAAVLSLSDAITSLSDAIDTLTTQVTALDTDLGAVESDVAQLDADVAALSGSYGVMPIGSIVAWHKNLVGTPALPTGWAECNGQTISDAASPYNGTALPNLNGEARFLRGSTTSGVNQNATRVAVTVETDAAHLFYDASGRNMTSFNNDYDATDVLGSNQRGVINRTTVDNAPNQIYAGRVRPVNMSVVWVMRVK